MFKNLSSIFMLLAALLATTVSHASNSAGELELHGGAGQREQALLLDTTIEGEINGMLASISVQQVFQNPSSDWVNGRYVFPLPDGAAVDSLRIKIGERVIDGIVKEKEQAKKIFKQAKTAGKKAGLLQQHRPNLFSISIANIGPQEKVIADITFINPVAFQNNVFSLSLPTTLTPRYVPDAMINSKAMQKELLAKFKEQEDVDINTGSGWAAKPSRVVDANDITPPQTHAITNQTSHRFSLSLLLNAGFDLQKVASNSHTISTNFENSQKVNISLANGNALMDSDLTLSWRAVSGASPKAALFQQEFNNAYYSMLMLTPPSANSALSLPRDVTFIIDSSGSMAGNSMLQAKQALSDGLSFLTANDRFNVIDFDSSFRALFSQSQAVTLKRINRANNMIAGLNADGGTEMLGALRYAMQSNSSDHTYLRQIVFITDGAIGNERELFSLIDQQLGDIRLFTVGIGSAPNSYFMNKAAKFGRGSYTVIRDLSQVNKKIGELFEKITRPVMRNIEVIWPKSMGQTLEQYPARIPDLYAGEPLTLLVKSSQPIDKLTALGEMLGMPWQQSVSLGIPGTQIPSVETASTKTSNAENIDTVWARQKIESLMDKLVTNELSQEQAKPQIINLGIAHNIVTKFTSFIAVEKSPSKPLSDTAKHKNIPNLMPKGNTMPIPQTATPAMLFSVTGLLLILLGLLVLYSARLKSSLNKLNFYVVIRHLLIHRHFSSVPKRVIR